MTARSLLPLALLCGALALPLGGCVSLLPKEKPAQLYRFGVESGGAPMAVRTRTVTLANTGFPREAASDGILAVTGAQTAYIAGARWVSPAAILFREAIPAAFDQPASRTRVLARGEVGRSDGVLQLEVSRFEVSYPAPGAAPVAVLSLRARLTAADGRLIGDRNFDVRKPAQDNRVGPIVTAVNAATAEALSDVVAWTDAGLDTVPAPLAISAAKTGAP